MQHWQQFPWSLSPIHRLIWPEWILICTFKQNFIERKEQSDEYIKAFANLLDSSNQHIYLERVCSGQPKPGRWFKEPSICHIHIYFCAALAWVISPWLATLHPPAKARQDQSKTMLSIEKFGLNTWCFFSPFCCCCENTAHSPKIKKKPTAEQKLMHFK